MVITPTRHPQSTPTSAVPTPEPRRSAWYTKNKDSVRASTLDKTLDVTPAQGHDLTGSLRVFTLSDALQMLALSAQTGTLTLVQGWNSRTLTFERGRITYLAAATRLASVEELLLRAGVLLPQQVAMAVYEASTRHRDVASVLLERGLVESADLARCQDQQLEETIFSLFLWRNGRFTFKAGEVSKEGGLAIALASERLIIDGTRRVDEWISISPIVPSVRLIFKAVRALPPGHSDATQQAVFELLDGQSDVVALSRSCGQTQFDTARALYGLVTAGWVVALPPDKIKIISLFTYLLEAIYVKLVMYGHANVAMQFEQELNRFAGENQLKVRLRSGKVMLSDRDTQIDTTALIDLYKLFIAIEQNRFSRIFPPDIVHGLIVGLYNHVSPDLQDMMRMYEFYEIEGLLPDKPALA